MKKLRNNSDWTNNLLYEYYEKIEQTARNYGLETYPCQIEILSAEQMLAAYSNIGMPLSYYHWSFGKQLLDLEKRYQKGRMGLSYEIVINANPCIAYLLEENTIVMQAMVMAHACFGHNSFFKNNYLFKMWTKADVIIDYLLFAKRYITACEEKYGVESVEELLDSCHALMDYGVDKYQRPHSLSEQTLKARKKAHDLHLQYQFDPILEKTSPIKNDRLLELAHTEKFPSEPEENILYFLEKYSPSLSQWQREIIRIIRKLATYFYPQKQTKLMNEGWATFWHYTIINNLYDEGYLTDEFMIEFIDHHSQLIYQPDFDDQAYFHINPYALGFAMFNDIKRICENPTEDEKQLFPDLRHKKWQFALDFAMKNFRDESFILQYLSPEVVKKFKFFSVIDDSEKTEMRVSAIQDQEGFFHIRETLSDLYNLDKQYPNLQIESADMKGNRELFLTYTKVNEKDLNEDASLVLEHLKKLWGFNVHLETKKV